MFVSVKIIICERVKIKDSLSFAFFYLTEK